MGKYDDILAMTGEELDKAAEERQRVLVERAKDKELQAKRDALILARLEEEHGEGKVWPVYTVAGMAAVTAPSSASMRRWREMVARSAGGGSKVKASAKLAEHERLARTALVYPELDVYEQWCEEHPGIPDAVMAATLKASGEREEEDAGK